MTTTQILQWIKTNLGTIIAQAITDSGGSSLPYTEPWIAGMVMQETGGLINRYAPTCNDAKVMSALMRGDYTQRANDTQKEYHGYGYLQIDVDSFPDFVNSGDWKDPYKTVMEAIKVLESDRTYLTAHATAGITDDQDVFNHYITAAYNCGAGNEMKVIDASLDPDAYTTGHDYARDVFNYAGIYGALT